ncbi:MAG TPA: ABC transporter ATP-binding protein [Synergistaceae bacterium]|nr:ABC transporter ATP-binding protein [Synergistaceae bacterium]HQF90825.1 ABC transporter ATP-binding protein [Synergistaceae bacterium]HQH77971.1 ABC transporter ATP-binding protein [Synergistaceae bacterium]HQK24079.1 ABC transporter ATP-binding protein [Synergistaceae bacterium]
MTSPGTQGGAPEIPPLLEVRGVTKIYRTGDGELRALDHVSFTVLRGEFVAIMGHSGSGKSTMMNVLGCLDSPTDGTYRLDGRDVGHLSRDELARVRNEKIGFVFQGFHLLPRATALENVELPLLYAGVSSRLRGTRASAMLDRVGLEHRKGHRPNQMSGGQQQRVAIARALVADAPLILADEPTGNLDSHTSDEIMELFAALHREGKTVVLVTHEADIAAWARRVLRFADGRLVEDLSTPGRPPKEA